MRSSVAALFFLFFCQLAYGQPNMGGPKGGGQQMNGRFYGKLVDSKTGKAVEFASVQLVQNRFDTISKTRKDMIVSGMLTKSNGEFSLENIPLFGQYVLKVSAIGFVPFEQKVSFELKMGGGGDPSAMLGMVDKDLGNIKLNIDEKLLENVTVSANNPGLRLGIDRKIFNVDKNIVSAGGTAIDVMRNVPSLNVDIDGNVTMRNNAPQIFVDGRPTNLTLEQIPADAIQSVELITNPSAKFDASGGTAGILNIVLKKEKKVGYNGSLRANLDSRARFGLGGDINLRQQKINVFANGMYNQRKSISTGTTDRHNFYTNPDTLMHQSDRSVQMGSFGFGRAGIDYFISNRNTLSVSGTYVKGKFKPNTVSDILYDTMSAPIFNEKRNTNTEGTFRNVGTMVSFKHNFPKAGREWTADLTFNKSKNSNNSDLNSNYYQLPANNLVRSFRQRQLIDGRNQNLILQTDYVNPINDKSKFEIGARAQLRKNSSANAFYIADPSTGLPVGAPTSLVEYESNDEVYAAYATYSNQLKSFGYQLGLRAESSQYEGLLMKTGELFNIDFPISLFPSVFLSKKLGETQSLQLNYSRRINRPNFWQLTPFTDSSDRLNPSKGNPGLKPEFTNSIELSYEKTFKNKDNFLASIYYKNTTDLITRYQESAKGSANEDVILSTYINANASYVTGLELIGRNKLNKWWEITTNFNLYTSDVDIDDPLQPEQDRLTSWFGKLNNTFKLPKNFTIQVSGDYQSKTILPPGGSGGGRGGGGGMFGGGALSASQGYIRPNYGVDVALRYEFLKNRTASLSVNMNDVFRTRRQDIHSESVFFAQDVFRRRDPQIVRINFNWRFGKFDASLFKRKNLRNQGDGGAMDGMGGPGQ